MFPLRSFIFMISFVVNYCPFQDSKGFRHPAVNNPVTEIFLRKGSTRRASLK